MLEELIAAFPALLSWEKGATRLKVLMGTAYAAWPPNRGELDAILLYYAVPFFLHYILQCENALQMFILSKTRTHLHAYRM